MKRFLPLIGVMLLMSGCIDCGPFPDPDIASVEATLNGNEAVGAADLKLGLSFGIRYVTQRVYTFPGIQTAYACSIDPSGLANKITLLSLTCDKTIRGIEAGQNLLTTSSRVWTPGYTGDEYATLAEWMTLINSGRVGNGYGYNLYPAVSDIYNIEIAFVPEGTAASAGEYTFTLTVEWQSGSFTKTFDPVRID